MFAIVDPGTEPRRVGDGIFAKAPGIFVVGRTQVGRGPVLEYFLLGVST